MGSARSSVRRGAVSPGGSIVDSAAAAEKAQGKICTNGNVKEKELRRAFTIAWNSIVENRESFMGHWKTMQKSENALERIRGKQMIELTAEGRLEFEIPELTRMVLEEVRVHNSTTFTITFLDGTVKNVKL